MKHYLQTFLLGLISFTFLANCGNLPLKNAKGENVSLDNFWIYLLQQSNSSDDFTVENRGIWLFGGIGDSVTLLSPVDLYDPVSNSWRSGVTSIPTPRMFSGVVAHKQKIYVFGGLDATGTALQTVEELDPYTKTWTTKSQMPQRLQGFVAASVGENIYLLAGTTTNDMTTGTLFNTVYKYDPGLDSWSTLTSNSTINANVDMGGCSIDGVIFFNTGRLYNTGAAQFTSDGYVPASNTTTNLAEASFTTARHGAACVCYRPKSTDPNPGDDEALLVVGGSTLANTTQSASAIVPSNVYDYYRISPDVSNPNTVTAGSVLPDARYYPAAEISYEQRSLYVLGGASAVNVPTNDVYSLSLSSPTGNAWSTISNMPRNRYGHRAVIINR